MKKIYLLILLLLPFFALQATGLTVKIAGAPPDGSSSTITGTIIDSLSKKPVDYATATLIDQASGKIITGALTDSTGKFTFSKLGDGIYKLKISFLSYADKIISGIKLSKGNTLKLGVIFLSPNARALGEVQVTAKKALIEEKIDRTIYNAENDLTTQGGDATDVMKRVPMVSVDLDGNLSLRGSQNITVLINGKTSAMMSASVADALKQIPADLIKSVEVITSPPAKYDAEGSGGIINIILKKNTLEGLSLNINSTGGTRGSGLGLNGGYKVGKFSFSLGGFGRAMYNTPGDFTNSQTVTNPGSTDTYGTTQSASTQNKGLFGRYNFGMDYDISEHNSLSLGIVVGANNRPVNQNNFVTNNYINGVLDSTILQNNKITNNGNQLDATLTYTLTGKKPEREFSLLAEFSQIKQVYDYENIFMDPTSDAVTSGLLSNNNSTNREVTFEADYQTPTFKDQLLEFGVKDIIRTVSSDYDYFSADDASLAFAPVAANDVSNNFNYKQNVTAGYVSYTLVPIKDYTLRVGARYEYTTIDANFETGSPVDIPDYGVLVPSVNFARKLGNGNMIKFGYTRRIQRPSLQFLNPSIQAANPLDITVGNPLLRPEYANNFELAYSTNIKSNNINISAFVRNTNNAIQTVRTADGDTVKTSYQNLGVSNAYGSSLSLNLQPLNKLSLNGGVDVYYSVLNNEDPDPTYHSANQGWVVNYRFFGSYDLSKEYSLQAFAFHRSKDVQLQGYSGGFGVYNLSFNRKFAHNKGTIGIAGDNFLTHGYHIPTVVNSQTITENSVNINYIRSFELRVTYRIGHLTNRPEKPKKKITNDDTKQGSSGGNDSN
jgi:outer membrane receptor protein involved in Fe transport